MPAYLPQGHAKHGLNLILATMIGLGLAMPAWSAPSQTPEIIRIAQNNSKKNLAVVDFENHTGDSRYDNLKRGLAESLTSKLAKRPELNLVERNQLEKAIKELGFAQSVYASATEAKELGKMAGADVLVTGALVKAGNRMELNVRVIQVDTAQILVAESYDFSSENQTLLAMDYLSLLIPQKLGLYVSDRELDLARNRLRADQQQAEGADNSWILWTVGGVVLVSAVVGIVVAVTRPGPTINQEVTGGEGSITISSF